MNAKRIALCALMALAPAVSVVARPVYKCVDAEGRTAYQSEPCTVGAAESRVDVAQVVGRPDAPAASSDPSVKRADAAAVRSDQSAAHSARAVTSRGPLPWTHRTLTVGMSDDEVLNLPEWGRPSRVTRARMPREWHEDWTYQSRDGPVEQHLHFVNARLASIDVEPAGEPHIQLTAQ
jgi:hypothetical protein